MITISNINKLALNRYLPVVFMNMKYNSNNKKIKNKKKMKNNN